MGVIQKKTVVILQMEGLISLIGVVVIGPPEFYSFVQTIKFGVCPPLGK